MNQPVALQGLQFALAVALGMALSFVYSLLRVLRRRFACTTGVLDTVFALTVFFSLLAWILYAGQGRFQLFLLPGTALGFLAFSLTLGRPLERLWRRCLSAAWRFAGFFLRPMTKILQKLKKICKNIFSFWGKWYRIGKRKIVTKSGKTGGCQHEDAENFIAAAADRSVPGGVRYLYPGEHGAGDR